MANVIYTSLKQHLMDGVIDLLDHTIKVMLVTSTYTPDADTHTIKSDVTNEVSGTGYSAGGKALTTPAVTADTTNHRGVYDADDVSWTSSTITARGAVLYDDTQTSPVKPIIAYIDFGSDQISTAGTFTIQWNATGIMTIT